MRLIISEKEIAARRIAQILSGNGVKEEKVYGVPVHSFSYNGADYKSIGLKGHILQVEFSPEYSNWMKVPPQDLIDAVPEKKPIEKRIIQALNKISGDAESIIIATDFDREGELIGYDAYDLLRSRFGEIPVQRARFSAITPKDIKNAFSNLDKLDLNLAFAGMARQDIDLIWGAVLTRFISLSSFQLREKFLSVGRVQTPTLAILVERELEIKNFVSVPYWQIKAVLENQDGEKFDAFYYKKKILDETEAKKIFDKVGSKGTISAIKEVTRSIKPPAPLNTTGLIVAASSMGFTAQKTINTAESLYINGFISYPRTDNTVYPSTIDLKDTISNLKKNNNFKEIFDAVLSQKELKPTRGMKKTTDHPPIYPVSAANRNDLSDDEWKLYELIVRRFACTLLPEALVKSMAVNIDISGLKFVANGSTMLKAGWTEFYPYYKHVEVALPDLKQDEDISVIKKEIEAKETKPPARYSQGRLVEKMEEFNLGTKATRHSIIQNLISRGYIKGNPLEATNKAIAVISALQDYASRITTPDMTSELETDMDAITKGELEKSEVVDISKNKLKEIMKTLIEKKKEIGKAIRDGIKGDEIVGKCQLPDCDGNLIIRMSNKTKKKFIGCSNYPDCTQTFSMPQNGLVLTTDSVCKTCSYPVIRVIRKGRKPWDLCINPECPSKNENYKNNKNKESDKKTD